MPTSSTTLSRARTTQRTVMIAEDPTTGPSGFPRSPPRPRTQLLAGSRQAGSASSAANLRPASGTVFLILYSRGDCEQRRVRRMGDDPAGRGGDDVRLLNHRREGQRRSSGRGGDDVRLLNHRREGGRRCDRHRPLSSTSARERRPECRESGIRICTRPRFETDHPVILEIAERGGDRLVADLACAGLASARDVGDLDLADPR